MGALAYYWTGSTEGGAGSVGVGVEELGLSALTAMRTTIEDSGVSRRRLIRMRVLPMDSASS